MTTGAGAPSAQRVNLSACYSRRPHRVTCAAATRTFLFLRCCCCARRYRDIEFILAHPPFDAYYTCGEHRQGELPYLGDDLGTDCMAAKLVTVDGRIWSRTYDGDGMTNEQWFIWRAQLHSPCECEVTKIHLNPARNQPGILGKPPASSIEFRQADGTHIVLAHIQEPTVKVGDHVAYGQPVALVGNNGYGRNPHVHVGAWRGGKALQTRWDNSNTKSASKPTN